MRYVATINIPGYLPEGDPVEFDDAHEAWEFLRDERARGEEDTYIEGDPDEFSATYHELDKRSKAGDGYYAGTIYGPTPGSDSPHDLGLAYTVTGNAGDDIPDFDTVEAAGLDGTGRTGGPYTFGDVDL